jgi:hypothetical protein
MKQQSIIPIVLVERKILLVRGQRVMVDSDLAELYGVSTKVLNQAVRRNSDRFPEDFMFQLTEEEKAEVVTICDHLQKLKFSSFLPYVFTEHGAIMLASVLNSPRAAQVSIYVVRAFVRLCEILSTHKELTAKLMELENRIEKHDEHIHTLFTAIRHLMESPEKPKREIGFRIKETMAKYGMKRGN